MVVLRVATTQFAACGDNVDANIALAEAVVRRAAADGAKLILLQELFMGRYWCQEQDAKHFERALPAENNHLLRHFSKLALELGVALPISFFERTGVAHFNSVRFIDDDGSVLPGVYRKSHIPDGPGYQEKFYFSPGDSGFVSTGVALQNSGILVIPRSVRIRGITPSPFAGDVRCVGQRVWKSRLGLTVGVGICWDQWFPECARAMALQGADVLLYPSAIGTEPQVRLPTETARLLHSSFDLSAFVRVARTLGSIRVTTGAVQCKATPLQISFLWSPATG